MIVSENANSYTLEVTQLSSPEKLHKGLWLVIAGVDDIPPHIALIVDGKYYSVSAKKIDVTTPLENFLKALSRRSVPTIFIKFHKSSPQGEDIGGAFRKYPTLGNGEHSCLWPVRDVFAEIFSEKYKNASLVFELLAMAQEDNLLVECKTLFVDTTLLSGKSRVMSNILTLPKYTHQQIREKINSILKVNE